MDTEYSRGAAWSGSDKTADQINYVTNLSPADLAEIKAALEYYMGFEGNAYEVDAAKFPLPTLGPRLEEIAKNLHEGTGFSLLRGFDTKNYSDEDNLIIFLGLGSYIGSQRGAQNKSRVMISHITDAKEWQHVPSEKRHGIHTNSALPFHNDMGCEILTLLYRQLAASGGVTSLASAAAIYDDLLKQPDILQTLTAADWPVQLSVKQQRFKGMPLLAYHEGHVIISADPGRLGLHPTTAEQPSEGSKLTEAQLKSLEVLNELAEKHALAIPAQAGDILFINNLGVLHKRDSYVDGDGDGAAGSIGEAMKDDDDVKAGDDKHQVTDKTKRRWLMRLWLRNDALSWEIPKPMKLPWEAAYGKGVGRLITPKYEPSTQPDYKEPRYTSGTAAWLIEDDED
ncbi:putative taurine catabolism dioxygenase [Diaporthe ampelina]|uniref:Putative taurine catabolism dioxygenase n=1 Tax=Diaporthe ampelina TaxID=1214573 RepID=A0A0G2FNT4_9PEZI|nr:putative taurine catabolism dioxygenase [Diaporthe ampelina]